MRDSKLNTMLSIIPALIQLFRRKRLLVNSFVIRLRCNKNILIIRVVQEAKSMIKITIIDVVNKQEKTLRINLNNNIENLLFLLSLIRDEYTSKILFTNKSNIV